MEGSKFWLMARELKAKDFLMYACIEKLCTNEAGYCFASNEAIGEKLGVSSRTVSRNINNLVDQEVLFAIELKRGNVTVERRIFTDYLIFKKHRDSEINKVKTTYKYKDGIITDIYNEFNPNPKIKKSKVDVTEDKIVSGTEDKNGVGTEDKIVYLKVFNNNLSNINTTTKGNEKISSSSEIKNFLVEKGFNDLTISSITKLDITLEELKTNIDYCKSNNLGQGGLVKICSGELPKIENTKQDKANSQVRGSKSASDVLAASEVAEKQGQETNNPIKNKKDELIAEIMRLDLPIKKRVNLTERAEKLEIPEIEKLISEVA